MTKPNLSLRLLSASCLVVSGIVQAQPPSVDAEIARQLPRNARVLEVKTSTVGGQEFTFVKFEDAQGEIQGQAFDRGKRKVAAERVPSPRRPMVGGELQDRLGRTAPGQRIKVNIALKVEPDDSQEPDASGTVEVTGAPGQEKETFTLNGRPASAEEVIAEAEQRRAAKLQRAAERSGNPRVAQLAQRHGLGQRPGIQAALEADRDTVTVELTAQEIDALARQSGDLVEGIELFVEPTDLDTSPPDPVQPAMQRTNIDPYALNYSGRKGGGVGIYMSEGGCPDAGFVSRYRKLSGTAGDHNKNVVGILRTVSPESYIYCRGSYSLPTSTDLAGYDGNPAVHVASQSWGSNSPGTYSTASRDWDNLVYTNNVAVFFAAGNRSKTCGDTNWTVGPPASGLNITSLGAYDDATNGIASFSCYGDPQTKNEKPEISAPGVNILASGITMSGTSQATPHAAAFAADLISAKTWMKLRPYLVKAYMLSGASDVISGGRSKVGLGGIDYYRAYYNGTYWWWDGSNGSYFNSSNEVNVYKDLSSSTSNVRVTLVWMNRGSYTYNNRTAAHPIGMDLDLTVYDPNGNYVGGSASYDNPFEFVSFNPAVTGTYRFRIKRYANRDTSSRVKMALHADW